MTDSLPQRRLFCYLETHAHLFDFGSKLLSSQSDWESCKTLECPSAVGCGMSLLSGDYGSISTLHAQVAPTPTDTALSPIRFSSVFPDISLPLTPLECMDLHLFFQECLTGCPLQIHQMCHLFHHVVIPGIIIEHRSPPLWSMDGCSLLSIPSNVLNTVRRGKRLMELLSLSMTAKMNPKKPKSLSMSDLPAACHTHLKPQGNECGSGGGKSANQHWNLRNAIYSELLLASLSGRECFLSASWSEM
ncbi:uncharacterized protein LOC102151579 [Canis lupus familiaris]|uniref:uncharacterized protein LOC102151579 n=1 Tax=Canis lupus familiaris TaxID=9615 RepID=UPI0015F1673A|nr:uncharacterized protein LOC102151579 [Canis lupus familiaris]XP_038318929.1 uncharacterized protein LOC102151579 [Canis lupus familiaris]XP_038439898.1 uncharacterized protein LOC102151579 [Canis lupus familiaris]